MQDLGSIKKAADKKKGAMERINHLLGQKTTAPHDVRPGSSGVSCSSV